MRRTRTAQIIVIISIIVFISMNIYENNGVFRCSLKNILGSPFNKRLYNVIFFFNQKYWRYLSSFTNFYEMNIFLNQKYWRINIFNHRKHIEKYAAAFYIFRVFKFKWFFFTFLLWSKMTSEIIVNSELIRDVLNNYRKNVLYHKSLLSQSTYWSCESIYSI